MSKYRKALTRSVLSEYGRFPNPEASIKLELGQIGVYDGWRCQFNWRHKLDDLEIKVAKPNSEDIPGFVNEIFSIGESTSVVFAADARGKVAADMSFKAARSLLAQSTSMICHSLDPAQLRRAIIDSMQKGKQWSEDWVVITHLFAADSYSQFFSTTKNAALTVAANADVNLDRFNLADTTLDLGITRQSGGVHNLLAQENVTPFFLVQKLKGWRREFRIKPDWSEEDLRLEPYG